MGRLSVLRYKHFVLSIFGRSKNGRSAWQFYHFISNILERKKTNINVVDPAKTELEISIGGLASIGNNTPVCGGRYEVDDGIKVNKQYSSVWR